MASRTYAIPLPYTTTSSDGLKIEAALAMNGADAVLARLKPPLVAKLKRVGIMHHETFSKAELDSIPADLWDRLAQHLG